MSPRHKEYVKAVRMKYLNRAVREAKKANRNVKKLVKLVNLKEMEEKKAEDKNVSDLRKVKERIK